MTLMLRRAAPLHNVENISRRVTEEPPQIIAFVFHLSDNTITTGITVLCNACYQRHFRKSLTMLFVCTACVAARPSTANVPSRTPRPTGATPPSDGATHRSGETRGPDRDFHTGSSSGGPARTEAEQRSYNEDMWERTSGTKWFFKLTVFRKMRGFPFLSLFFSCNCFLMSCRNYIKRKDFCLFCKFS